MIAELKGENRIELFRRVAQKLVSEITEYKNVEGIMFMGGLARGFTDKFSDLDMTVLLGKRDERLKTQIRELSELEMRRSVIDIDLEIHVLEDFKKRKWNETDRWDFSHGEIVFDLNGKIRKMFEAKLKMPKDFWIRRIAACSEYMKWYCCPPKDDVGTIAEAWIDRGDLTAAHDSLNYAVELFFEAIFALNKEFLPPPKWRIHYSYKLKWLPEKYKELLEEMVISKSLTTEDFDRRLEAIRKAWSTVLPKIQHETGLTPSQTTKYYVEKILQQS